MAFLGLGVGLFAFRKWLDKRPAAYARVETLFWFACVLFVGVILAALLLQVGSPAPTR